MIRFRSLWAVAVVGIVFGNAISGSRADDPRYTITQNADDTFIRIPATDGKIASDLLMNALSASAQLDGTGLSRHLKGDLDLSRNRTEFTFLLIEKALSDRADLGIERDGAGRPLAMVIVIDREKLEADARSAKRKARQWMASIDPEANDHVAELSWGLRGAESLDLRSGQRLVVLVHGIQGGHDSLAGLQAALTKAQHRCATYAYPNDGPIAESAQRLSRDLRALRLDEGASIALVSHSMGGLVARRIIEDAALDDPRVDRLVMIAPPNQGSNMAYLPGSLDWHEHLWRRPVDQLPKFVFRSTVDGLNEAQDDLQPESRFLLDLNARSRNLRVQYSILLGTNSPSSPQQLAQANQQLNNATTKSATARLFAPRLKKIFDHPLELTAGQGDGAVAVERGQLAGVKDVQLLPMDHWTVTHQIHTEAGQALVQEISRRLK